MYISRDSSRNQLISKPDRTLAAEVELDQMRFPPNDRPVGGLPDLLRTLMRHKRRLLIGALGGLFLGLALALISTPQYKARVVLEIQNPNADFLNARSVNSVAEASAADSGSLTDVATEIKIMESDQLLDRVIAKLQASQEAKTLEASASHQSLLSRLLRKPPLNRNAISYRMRERARPSLAVKQLGPTRAVEVVYSSPDPVFAARFANMLALQYIEMSEEARWSKSRRTEESLSRELAEVRARLQESRTALQRYASSSGLIFMNGQNATTDSGDMSETKLSQLQAQLSQVQQQRMTAQSHYESARTAAPEDVSDVLADPQLLDLTTKLTDLRRQRAELATTFTDDSDKVKRITAQILPLEGAFAKQRQSILNRIEKDYGVAKRQENLVRSAYDEQVRVVEGKEVETVQYSLLRQDVDSNQKLYDSVLEQVKRAGIASAVRSNNIEVFDVARVPFEPYAPRPALSAAFGSISGLLVVALITIMMESGDRRIHLAGELQGHLQLPELGVIPANQPSRLLGVGSKVPKSQMELVTWASRQSITDEAYRALLTSILYSKILGAGSKAIVLTSANPGEGKTTTVCNLGILMAELDLKVLLIDADLRRPRLHEIFQTSNSEGLTNLLAAEIMPDPHMAVEATFIPRLSVLSSGQVRDNPGKLLHSRRLTRLIKKLRNDFDVILIDTSPTLVASDARILGRSSDAVVIITRAGATTVTEVESVANMFSDDGTPVLGTVLNNAKSARSSYSYYAASA